METQQEPTQDTTEENSNPNQAYDDLYNQAYSELSEGNKKVLDSFPKKADDFWDYCFTKSKKIHETAKAKGWWEKDRSMTHCLSLVHSELSEALEEERDGSPGIYFMKDGEKVKGVDWQAAEDGTRYVASKPEGMVVELADATIRLMDACGYFKFNIMDKESEVHKTIFGENKKQVDSSRKRLMLGCLRSNFEDDLSIYAYHHDRISDCVKGASILPVIFSLDYYLAHCIARGWDIYAAMEAKMNYNNTRSYRHGGKKF